MIANPKFNAKSLSCLRRIAESGHKVCDYLRSRYENATPNLCWVFCALLGVLCN